MRQRAARLVLGVLLCASACGRAPELAHAHASPEAAAAALLDALRARDREALESLALDEREFRNHVWPYLPAARPERNLPFSYVWGDLHQKSLGFLAHTLAVHGGRVYELVDVAFDGVTDHGAYRVHRGAVLRVRDGAGTVAGVRLSGSMIERDGRWKVFSYVVND